MRRLSQKENRPGSSPGRGTNADVAQLVEQRIENPCVTGSNPVFGTKCDCGGMVYTADLKSAAARIEGSSLSSRTINYF